MTVKISTNDGQTAIRTFDYEPQIVISWEEHPAIDEGVTRFQMPIGISISKYYHPLVKLEVTPS